MPHPTAETVPAGTGPRPSGAGSRRAILSGAVGNALEWYDFAVYGYFASVIGARFFPAEDPVASLMATFGVFAAAFLARPFGSVVFGHVGDRFGRRSALILSVTLMATTTTLVGLLPTYETIGAAAPILLVALRLLQGLSVGGEHTTSVIFLVEHAPPKRKALYGSFAVVAVAVGTLLGSAVGALLEILLEPAALSAWGWRIPFLLGAVLGVATFILRRSIAADAPAARQDLPIVRLFREDWRELLRGIGISATTAVTFYLTFVYLITYIERIDALSASTALRINTINMAALIVVFLASGLLADRIGLKAVLVAGAVCAIVFPWPLFLLLESGDVFRGRARPVRPCDHGRPLRRRLPGRDGGPLPRRLPLFRRRAQPQHRNGALRRHRASRRRLPRQPARLVERPGILHHPRRGFLTRLRPDGRPRRTAFLAVRDRPARRPVLMSHHDVQRRLVQAFRRVQLLRA